MFGKLHCPWLSGLAISAVVLLLVGCGSDEVEVRGRLFVEDTPMRVADKKVVKVALRPQREDSTKALIGSGSSGRATPPPSPKLIASVAEDGSFELPEVAPGTYYVLVSDFTSYPSGDRLAAHFRAQPESLEIEVTSEQPESPIEIRLREEWFEARRK